MKIISTIIFIILFSWSLSAVATPDEGPVAMGEFYTSLPDIQPDAKLGDLIKAEKITTKMPGTQAWKIAYVSSDVNGAKTLATGILVAPEVVAANGGRPIMAWAHGTTGTAENCGPSQVLDPAEPLNQYFLMDGNSYTDYGLPAMETFIKAGYVIVATDYQGLGGGGKHHYTVSATQGRDVINSIRAATLVKEVGAGNKAIVYGWSQGGGSTIAAASLTDYLNTKGSARDDIQIIGFVAMAPFDVAITMPQEKTIPEADAIKYLQNLGTQFSASIFNFTHYAQNLWGMVAAFPELKLEDVLTSDGVKAVDEVMARKCMHVATDTFNYTYGDNYKNLLRPDIKNSVAWIAANKKGGVLPVKPMAPVIIYFGDKDVTVPPFMGKLYFDQMCKLGGNITRIQLPGAQTHFSTPASAEPFYVKWVADRFAGKPAPNGCPATS
ncbi:MAG: lipase family protein [Pseudomonadota bacterium]